MQGNQVKKIFYYVHLNFLDFENFKNIFLKVIELRTEKERAEYAFEILAYPDKNEIKIKNLKEIFNKEEKMMTEILYLNLVIIK